MEATIIKTDDKPEIDVFVLDVLRGSIDKIIKVIEDNNHILKELDNA